MKVSLNPENSTGLSAQLLNNAQPIFDSMVEHEGLREFLAKGELSKDNIRILHYMQKQFSYFLEDDFLPKALRKLIGKLTNPKEKEIFEGFEKGMNNLKITKLSSKYLQDIC